MDLIGSLKYNASVLPSTAIDNREGMAIALGKGVAKRWLLIGGAEAQL
jgi:hypothetical protein